MNSSRQIKFGALISYFAIAFNIAAGLIYTPWMITKIGQGNYGLYTIATSLITLFIIDFGMSAAVSRFLSIYNAKGEQKKANDFMGIVYKMYLVVDVAITVALVIAYFFIDKIYVNLTADEITVLKSLYIIVAIYNVLSFPFITLNGVLNAYEKFVQLKICDLFYKVSIIIMVVIALLCGAGVEALVIANALGGLLTIIIKLAVIRRSTPLRANLKYFDKRTLKDIFGFSIWTTVSSLAQRLIFNITPTIIAAFSATGSIGTAVFGLASTIEGYVYTFSSAINGMFMPRISRIVVSGKKDEELTPLMIKIGRLQIMIVGIITVGFIALGKPFIVDIWHKADFTESYICAVLLILPSLFYLPLQIANTTLIVENKVKLQAFVFVGMGIINIAFSIPLSKYYGAIGASLAIFIAYSVRNVLMILIYEKNMKLNMKKFFKETYLKLMPQLILSCVIGWLAVRYNPVSNVYLNFIINGIVLVGTYLLIMILCGFNDYEKSLFMSVVQKLKQGKLR